MAKFVELKCAAFKPSQVEQGKFVQVENKTIAVRVETIIRVEQNDKEGECIIVTMAGPINVLHPFHFIVAMLNGGIDN